MSPTPPRKPNEPVRVLPPHPATVVQPKRPFGLVAQRPPHPATSAQGSGSHTAKTAQRMEEISTNKEVVTCLLDLYEGKYALRSCSSLKDAKRHLDETIMGDAVPLNMAGAYEGFKDGKLVFYAWAVKESSTIIAAELRKNAIKFISKCLEWNLSLTKDVNDKSIEEIIRCFDERPFVLLKNKEGAQTPRDVDKKEYCGLGKCGNSQIHPEDVIGIFGTDGKELDLNIKMRMFSLEYESKVDAVQGCIALEIFDAMMLKLDMVSLTQ